jgi:putative ABC transport system permease protein
MLTNDLRIAIRTLVKTRGFTVVAISTLALGMTLCAAVLLVLNAYLFKSLPYPAAQRLYSVRYGVPGQEQPENMEALDWRSLNDVIEHPIAWDLDVFYLIGGEQTESAPGAWVTPGFVDGLGIQPAIGRGFDADAFLPNSPNVALISHRLWQQRYGGDPNIMGRRFEAYVSDRPDEAETFTIIGVMPADFWHLNTYTEILAPLRAPTYPYMVRLREGVPPDVAAARVTALVRGGTMVKSPEWQVELVSTHGAYVQRLLPILRALAAAAALVLLVSWANVAGLLLIRATRRQKEIAVRMALGAGRAAIARLLIIETLVLGAAATLVGLLASGLLLQWLAPLIQRELGRPAPGGLTAFSIDSTVVLAAAAFGLIAALACGLAPLVATWRPGVHGMLSASSRSATEGRGSQRTRSMLIVLEVAASLALLSGSILMMQSVVRLLQVDFGIRADRVLSTSMTLRQRNYPDGPRRLAFVERVLPRLEAIPGVESVAFGDMWPLQPPRSRPVEGDRTGTRIAGRVGVFGVTARYFSTLNMQFAAGRVFSDADRLGSEPVAIVSESLARLMWPDGDAIGAHIFYAPDDDTNSPPVGRRIVGIVRDVRQAPVDDERADLYLPLLQSPGRFAFIYVRTTGTPAAWVPQIRAAIGEIDPEIAMNTPRPLQTLIDEQLSRPKFLAWLLAGFAATAAVLALIGVYGVIAYAVRQREREIAVRMAVGADSRIITQLFLKQGAVVLLAGLALGLLAALGAGRALESQLFGVRPGEPLTLALAALSFAAAGGVAIWWPARRAAGTDPAAALKDE